MLDLRDLFVVLRRQAAVLSLVVALGVGLAVIYLLVTPPQFMATTRLLVDTRGQKIHNFEDVTPGLNAEPSTIESQVEFLRSRRIADRVIRDLRSGALTAPANTGTSTAVKGDLEIAICNAAKWIRGVLSDTLTASAGTGACTIDKGDLEFGDGDLRSLTLSSRLAPARPPR